MSTGEDRILTKGVARLLSAAAATCLLATAGFAQQGGTTSGADLRNFCAQPPDSPMHGACAGYIVAISEITPRCDDGADGPRFRVPEDGLTRATLIEAVTRHLDSATDVELDKEAHGLVRDALAASFPCE
ncbi:MAG: Rap1a/Tai family immunity protein [Hyphomicrobiales bacterium]